MSGTLRSARNPVAVAIMGALTLVFLIVGLGGGSYRNLMQGVKQDAVVSVGSHSISTRDFQRMWDQQKQQWQQQSGQDLTNQFLVQQGADSQVLDQVANEQATLELISRAGIAPAPSLVDDEIKKFPWAFDKVTGQFSQQQFVQALASQGLTPAEAQTEISDELAMRHFGIATAGGFQAPWLTAALAAAEVTEARDVSYFVMGANAVQAPAQPTDAQLEAFMKAHAAQLTMPERRIITLARFSAKEIAPTIKVDPAAVAKEFAFRKDTLSTPEKRTVVQIPVKSAADGAEAARRLGAGEDPTAIAKSLGVEPVVYDQKPQSAIADPKLAQAAFGMKEGQVSGPVAGGLGLAVLKVAKVTPGAPATLASATPQIEAELRQKQAAQKAYDESKAFDDARQTGASVADAARKAGVAVITLGPVTAKGTDDAGKPNPMLTDRVLKAAFAAPTGQEGDLNDDAGQGEYFALKIEKVLPPALPALADKRPELARAYMMQTLFTELKAKAAELQAMGKKDGNLNAAAAKVGAQLQHQAGMTRIKAQQDQSLGREFLQGVFGAKPGDVFPAGGQSGVYIVRVDAVHPGDPKQTAQLVAAIRGRISQAYAEDLLGAVKAGARKDLKVTVNRNLALQTLGVDPATLGKGGAQLVK
jgi:peptidyl-prolyl cis-trans isomerase D